ncbi:hypothetical protein WA026_016931 [Henosepilachna vigintioctopunctata]|uniref:RING-type E3 ubiquitin transferase n=1 Tax=Henosepilachna vigintioctopunctata TaxID=420089 RepID=A0AAW1U082_9CUCU
MNSFNEDMICSSCAKYLTVPPIIYVISKGNVCGRCCNKTEKAELSNSSTAGISSFHEGQHQILYEFLLKKLSLPCCYKPIGCEVALKWGQVPQHEDTCFFRNTVCPLSDINKEFLSLDKVCNWRGNNNDLIGHILSKHKDYYCHPIQVYLNPTYTTMLKFDVIIEHCVMMVLFKYNQMFNKYVIYVFANLTDIECELFQYQAEVNHESSSLSMIFRDESPIKPMCDIIFGCDLMNGLDVPIKSVFGNENTSKSFHIKVSICKKSKKYFKELKQNLPHDSIIINKSSIKPCPINEEGLRELECPVCKDYMVPPIFLCAAGHSVCNSCTIRVTSCPTCRAKMSGNRNYTLESLTSTINYPCKNRSSGCVFVSSGDKIRNHEKNCTLAGKKCVFKCHWTGNALDMILHLNEKHILMQVNQIKTICLAPHKQINEEAIVYDNQVFLFTCSYGYKMHFQYTLQHLKVGDASYKYELKLVDSSDNDLYVSMSHLCSLLPNRDDKKEKKHLGNIISYESIQRLVLRHRELQYKIRILKIKSK